MKLLLCSDGSPQAERAVRLGAHIAAACAADVTLLGIAEISSDSKPLFDSLKKAQSLLQDKKINAELITKSGKTIEEIAKRTQESKYDLVIIGAVRKQARGLYWMSSKSYAIMKKISPPVLSVAGHSQELRRILVCSGGKRYIDSAIQLTAQIARGLKADVLLLHVLPELPAIYSGFPRLEESPAQLLHSNSELAINLRRSKEILEASGVQTDVRVRHGPVLDQILEEIETSQADLVVTGSAISPNFRTYVLGDITRELVNRANCAVLVARTQETPYANPADFFRSLVGRIKSP